MAAAPAIYETRPALWVAASLGHSEEVGQLLEEGADIEKKSGCFKTTPLLEAVLRGVGKDTVRILLEHGADVTTTNPLHAVTSRLNPGLGDLEVARLLLEYGADVSTQDDFGDTPLHLATEAVTDGDGHYLQMVGLFLEHGANPAAKNNEGNTPFHNAVGVADLAIVRLLLDTVFCCDPLYREA
ncbi:ankyrin repeat-containing domain protein [Baffinella frigidus]|nr:ankyrin repeat-containing domain protein [Cryptophyta sp. CCMP2293]